MTGITCVHLQRLLHRGVFVSNGGFAVYLDGDIGVGAEHEQQSDMRHGSGTECDDDGLSTPHTREAQQHVVIRTCHSYSTVASTPSEEGDKSSVLSAKPVALFWVLFSQVLSFVQASASRSSRDNVLSSAFTQTTMRGGEAVSLVLLQ